MKARDWRCRGCLTMNRPRTRKCGACAKARPKPRRVAALEIPYETYVELNGGEHCAICLAPPKEDGRRLDRDHDHRTGKPRGLLCGGRMGCNRKLGRVDNVVWLRAAADYLERAVA